MRRAAIVLLAWGAWLGVLIAVQAPFGPRTIQPVELGVAAGAAVAAGLLLWLADTRGGAGEGAPRAVTDSSASSATLACGLALALLGAGFGLWLILIGAGVGALGLGGLVRESRGRRRAVERLQRRERR